MVVDIWLKNGNGESYSNVYQVLFIGGDLLVYWKDAYNENHFKSVNIQEIKSYEIRK